MSVVLSAHQFAKVTALRAKGPSLTRSRVRCATWKAMAGAGKKPNDDDKPRGFPRFVHRAEASLLVRILRLSVPSPPLTVSCRVPAANLKTT